MKSKALKNMPNVNGVGVISAYLVVFIGLGVACPNFLKFFNTMIGIRQAIYTATVAFATTSVISLGGIDLSVGSTMGINGVVLAATILGGYNIYLAVGVVTLLGTFIGLVSGLLVTKLRIVHFTATLGIASILWGLIHVYTKGIPLYSLKCPEIQSVDQGCIGVVPFPTIPTPIILLVCYYLFYKTKFGRYAASIGSNEDAAKLVGINMDKVKILVFMLSGILCIIAGVILALRSEAAVPEAGNAYEMDAIAATVIGRTSMLGREGSVAGIAFGAILMAMTKNSLSPLNVNTFQHQVVTGVLIPFTAALDGYTSNRAARDR